MDFKKNEKKFTIENSDVLRLIQDEEKSTYRSPTPSAGVIEVPVPVPTPSPVPQSVRQAPSQHEHAQHPRPHNDQAFSSHDDQHIRVVQGKTFRNLEAMLECGELGRKNGI